MVDSMIPKGLPDCDLIRILAEKAGQRQDTDFDFLGKLNDFRKRVSDEVRLINILFPEYTPHDEKYHLKRLFNVASVILSRDHLEGMNCSELFVLAVALYGHDWGMAVSEPEKQYILTGELPPDKSKEDFELLPDERTRVVEFAKKHRLSIDKTDEISIEMWREYVRQTHALRSGARVSKFFQKIDGGVADAASRVCEGHWLDFENLQDYKLYPPDYAMLEETINLRALTVYLRLIDLLDLSEDRTPYIIWKFLDVQDPRSRMEWAKHRALRPIASHDYQDGRILQVDGSTDDHEVYAALEDLHIWCEQQLRGCNDLLARMNDDRHKLDIYNGIDWRVAAKGFNPVLIQFEFNRERMFEILSDDIYQGDHYVFLRELLQNSIDAIRMRREVLERKGIDPGKLGAIRVDVQHEEGGSATITWSDDGLGMDEYVIQNYLAIAGKSYYRSSDFQRQGLNLDPISRFGVGILSCFMVADRLEIVTYKDPYFPPSGRPLKIIIPAANRQFRIEATSESTAKVGTTVKVFVDGSKLPLDKETNQPKTLNITAYLSILAGFVEFPIVITEGDQKTIVLHPKQNAEDTRQRFGDDFVVQKIDMGFSWKDQFFAQDIFCARRIFQESQIDINADLGLCNYEGILTYLVPKGENVVPIFSHDRINTNNDEEDIRKNKDTPNSLANSVNHSKTYAVYRDGILIPKASPPISLKRLLDDSSYNNNLRILPNLVVNIPKLETQEIDLSRANLQEQNNHWDSPISLKLLEHVQKIILKRVPHLEPVKRFVELLRLLSTYRISPENIWECFPKEKWPILCMKPEGKLEVLELGELDANKVCMLPYEFAQMGNLSKLEYINQFTTFQKEYEGPLKQWNGEPFLIALKKRKSSYLEEVSALSISSTPIQALYSLNNVRFLSSPFEDGRPILQEVCALKEKVNTDIGIKPLLDNIGESFQIDHLTLEFISQKYQYEFPLSGDFSTPFEKIMVNENYFNLKHQVFQRILRILIRRVVAQDPTTPDAEFGCFDDFVKELFTNRFSSHREHEKWEKRLKLFFKQAKKLNLTGNIEEKDLLFSGEEFIRDTRSMQLLSIFLNDEPVKAFGAVLS